jgi:hypothetical protein
MENYFHKIDDRKLSCIATSCLILMGLVSVTNPIAYASSDAYDSGYDHGCDDAGISDPSDRYYNQPERGPAFHTEAFNSGYEDGFNACSRGGPDESQREIPQIPQEDSVQPRRGGMDWNNVCNSLQQAGVLLQSCNELVNSDGSFTQEGERAYGCIRNGVFLAGGGMAFQLPLPIITAALRVLETPTGCSGIVDWSSINRVSNLGGILSFFG